MPTSFQAPSRKDKASKTTYSQSAASNVSQAATTVADILQNKGGEVFAVGPDITLRDAVVELRDRHIGALLVNNAEGALIGIVSERDIVRKLADSPGQTLPMLVSDVMTREVETCAPQDPLISVLRAMTAGRFRHMPVVEGDTLVGMVTIGDVVNHRLNELEHEAMQLKQLIVG
ncbi:CBS domain-containing protein [Epibacterium sp. SM1969]|uniref:CBS domain-containing protein n=1 Tax=Tritonibacter aquimaris TaxID=2663379 RepID=A0A844AYK5_9RHOB|nr:CBS domain-containing protein [Tritonibacter aquimaris]MQY43042.1 CBS domain-containing protein [Tritonibacter aquimaris]